MQLICDVSLSCAPFFHVIYEIMGFLVCFVNTVVMSYLNTGTNCVLCIVQIDGDI